MTPVFDPHLALRTFNAHGVSFVVIGGFASVLWGSPSFTYDLDICYERNAANHDALAKALRELHATLRGAPAGLPFVLDAKTIAMGDSFTFDTIAGGVDCLGTPSGTNGYPDLIAKASEVDLGDGLHVRIVAVDDLIRMKSAAGRAKDIGELKILEAIKEEQAKK
ncbi:MAG TPA: hypothetical protein VGQ76_06585 [Thermoanaerobaculia bacterium]|jgi:hypothetical protein|nr:hypothetical protein [Thermoanaerobaculia bacterium]